MKRAAIYVRVSTEEQRKHGLSVDNQLLALQDYCKNNRYTIAGIYNDAGISARKTYTKRPGLLQMIKDCQAGNIDIILFTKLDRFFRSVKDYYICMEQIGDVPWRAIWEDFETESSGGIFKVNMMLSFAQSEADKTSERVNNTFDYKRAKGEYVGGNKAPLGYMRNGKQYVKNPAEQAGIEAFFKTYLATLNQIKAIESAKEHGLDINKYKSQRILYHPAYYGGLPYCPETYITIDEHNIIEKAKRAPSRTQKDTGYKYIFSHLLRCGVCGGGMSGGRCIHKRKDGKETHSVRYFCFKHENNTSNCTGSSISEKNLEAYVLDAIANELNTVSYKATIKKTKKDKEKKLANLKAKQKRLKDLYELGDIDFTEYKDKRNALIHEIDNLQKEEPMHKIHQLPNNWLDIYNSLDIEHRNAFLSSFIDHIEITGFQCKNPTIFF